MRLNQTSKWKVMTIWISWELPFFNSESLDILCPWIGHPSEKLWSFEFAVSFCVQFRASRYIMRLNRTSEWMIMTIWITRELLLFIFRASRYITGLTHTPESKVWVVWISRELPYSITSVSIYYAPASNIWLKSNDHLNISRASVVQFWASRYIIYLNLTSEWKVMTIWISREFPFFNFEHLDILFPGIGHPCEKLWAFKFLESFHC